MSRVLRLESLELEPYGSATWRSGDAVTKGSRVPSMLQHDSVHSKRGCGS